MQTSETDNRFSSGAFMALAIEGLGFKNVASILQSKSFND